VIVVGLHEVGRGGDSGAKGEVSRRCERRKGKGKGKGLEGGVEHYVLKPILFYLLIILYLFCKKKKIYVRLCEIDRLA